MYHKLTNFYLFICGSYFEEMSFLRYCYKQPYMGACYIVIIDTSLVRK